MAFVVVGAIATAVLLLVGHGHMHTATSESRSIAHNVVRHSVGAKTSPALAHRGP